MTNDTPSWTVDYEQCGLDQLWHYKFDHEPKADGAWHRLNNETVDLYRILNRWVQVVGPGPESTHEAWEAIRAQVCNLEPLECVRGCADIFIEKINDVIRVSESDAMITFETASLLTTKSINDAYEKLQANPRRWE